MARKNARHRFLQNLSAIADYLGCSKRTVQRYMKDAGLPVLSLGRNKVGALPERLDTWRAARDEDQAA
jgi:predicted transcriptional regulator